MNLRANDCGQATASPIEPMRAAIVFDFAKSGKHYRALLQLEYGYVGQARDSWSYMVTQVTAPVETFAKDLPVMLAQTNSLKENTAGIQRITNQKIAAQNEWLANQQAQLKKTQAANEQQHRDFEQRQLEQDRSHANFDEYIRGTTTVVDSTTGEKKTVDLANVHDVVENLNASDPGRYQELHLQDELYPLPAQK